MLSWLILNHLYKMSIDRHSGKRSAETFALAILPWLLMALTIASATASATLSIAVPGIAAGFAYLDKI